MITYKKICSATAIIVFLFFVPGCAIYESNYFGDHEQPTTHVEIYQDSKDVSQPFKVIGHFIAEIPDDVKGQNKVRLQLIEKAKKVGANGLIFSDLSVKSRFKSTISDYTIKADAIKFVTNPNRRSTYKAGTYKEHFIKITSYSILSRGLIMKTLYK